MDIFRGIDRVGNTHYFLSYKLVLKSPERVTGLQFIENFIYFFIFGPWSVMVGLFCPWGPVFDFKIHKYSRCMVDPPFL